MKDSILIVKNDLLSSESLVDSLSKLGYIGLSCVHDATLVKEVLCTTKPRYSIIDVSISSEKSIDIIRLIRNNSPHTKCIIIIQNLHTDFIVTLTEDISGCLTNKSTIEELRDCFISLENGCRYLSKEIKNHLLCLNTTSAVTLNKEITKGEEKVLKLMALGYNNQKMAKMLFRSPNTVASVKYTLQKKLDLASTHELMAFAVSVYKN